MEAGELPSDDKRVKKLVLSKSKYLLQDGVLYCVEADKSLRVILPESMHKKLFADAHDGNCYAVNYLNYQVAGSVSSC